MIIRISLSTGSILYPACSECIFVNKNAENILIPYEHEQPLKVINEKFIMVLRSGERFSKGNETITRALNANNHNIVFLYIGSYTHLYGHKERRLVVSPLDHSKQFIEKKKKL